MEKPLQQLIELFGDTYEENDLQYVLEEVRGDLTQAIDRISEGRINTWGEVTKNKKGKSSGTGLTGVGFSKTTFLPGRGGTTSSRGGRGGSNSSRGGRGGRAGYTSNERSSGHGGEKSSMVHKLSAPSAEPAGESWEGSLPNQTLFNPVKSSDQDWSGDFERETRKLPTTKKGFTIVKAKNSDNSVKEGPKKTNWASIVKGPDPPPPEVVAEEPQTIVSLPHAPLQKTQSGKKLTLVKKDSSLATVAVVTPIASPLQRANPNQSPASAPAQLSPGMKPSISPSKQVESNSAMESASSFNTATNPSAEQLQLPPGLGRQVRNANQTSQQAPRTGKQESPVVMQSGVSTANSASHVQFGSFGIVKATTSTSTEPMKSPVEESVPFQFNPTPQSTSTATQSSRPASASTEQTVQMGAPGLPWHYQQQFGVGGSNYSMYETEQQQRAMGYYVQENQSYGSKYTDASAANPSQSPSAQHAQANVAAHLSQQQSFNPYPYYPYYLNQYQQGPYQQPVYQQQHFPAGAKGSYNGFQQGQTAGVTNLPATNGSQKPSSQNLSPGQPAQQGYPVGYGAQQFYPSGYDEQDYGKAPASYGQQNFFGGQAKNDYKAQQNRARPPYEKNQQQLPASGANGAAASAQHTAQPTPYGYGAQQQFPGMQYQQFMMHPQGYPQYQNRGHQGGYQ